MIYTGTYYINSVLYQVDENYEAHYQTEMMQNYFENDKPRFIFVFFNMMTNTDTNTCI